MGEVVAMSSFKACEGEVGKEDGDPVGNEKGEQEVGERHSDGNFLIHKDIGHEKR